MTEKPHHKKKDDNEKRGITGNIYTTLTEYKCKYEGEVNN
jgi:hypothetical protein